VTFRESVTLWIGANGISSDVLNGPRFALPIKQKDAVWIWDELKRDDKTRDESGHHPWDTIKNKFEFMMFCGKAK
jgi:hypothetical protein